MHFQIASVAAAGLGCTSPQSQLPISIDKSWTLIGPLIASQSVTASPDWSRYWPPIVLQYWARPEFPPCLAPLAQEI